jgi:SUMO ligase MMS21 Smc5/6 complex component
MEKLYGIVKEVYIPEEYKNGNLLDVMDRSVIGFKVLIDDEIQDFQFEQDEFNVQIMKNDEVLIIKQVIDGKEYIDIEGVDYE